MNSSQTFMHFVGIDAWMVRCTICAKNVKYGTNGVRSLGKKHCTWNPHVKALTARTNSGSILEYIDGNTPSTSGVAQEGNMQMHQVKRCWQTASHHLRLVIYNLLYTLEHFQNGSNLERPHNSFDEKLSFQPYCRWSNQYDK